MMIDGVELGRSFCDTYPNGIEVKVEHRDGRATFLNYNLLIHFFAKIDSFFYLIVAMPDRESNAQQNTFSLAMKDKFLRITCSTLCLSDILAKAKMSLESNKKQCSQYDATSSSLKKK